MRAGISGLDDHPSMLDKVGEPMVVAREPTLPPTLEGVERFARLAEPALAEALMPLAPCDVDETSVPLLIGTPDLRPGLPTGIEEALRAACPRHGVTLLANGNAAGVLAMKHARELLQGRGTRFCIAGGVDSYLTPDSLEWMDEHGILKSSANRNGFPPGEAAGFCLLTTGATAVELGLPVLGWLEALGSAREESPIRSKTICVGRGLSQAFQDAIESLRLPEQRIDDSICDLNGEPYRSEEFAFTVLRTQMAFVDATRFVTPADCWGDVGAASGPLFANLAATAATRGYAKGPRTLIWTSSENGDRAAAVVRGPDPTGSGGR